MPKETLYTKLALAPPTLFCMIEWLGLHPGFSSSFICTYRKPGFNRARNHSLPNSEGILNGNEGLRIHNGGESLVRKRETRITKASIGITVMFLICNTPRVIPNLVEVLMDQNAFPKVRKICQFFAFFDPPTYQCPILSNLEKSTY